MAEDMVGSTDEAAAPRKKRERRVGPDLLAEPTRRSVAVRRGG
jgi:hypothetical protein